MAGYSSAGVSAAQYVTQKLIQRKVVLFVKVGHPSCLRIQKYLDSYRLKPQDYEISDIQSRQDCSQIETWLQQLCLTDRRQVQQSAYNISASVLRQNPNVQLH